MKIYRSVADTFSIFFFLLLCPILAINAADTPKLLKAIPLSQTAIQLQFDGQSCKQRTAEDLKNYQIAPDVQLEYALLDQRLNRVLLLTYDPIREQKKPINSHASEIHKLTGIVITLPSVNEITFGSRRFCYLLWRLARHESDCQ